MSHRFVFLLCALVLLVFASISDASQPESLDSDNKCECAELECGCCGHLESKKLGLNDTACVNITYLPNSYGVSLTFELDGKILFNKTVSLMDPSICIPVPYVGHLVDVCVDFYDVEINPHNVSGCVKVELDVFDVDVADVDLGCFVFDTGLSKEQLFTIHQKMTALKKQNPDLTAMKLKLRGKH